MDGSLGSRTALFYQPYNDDPKTAGSCVTPEDSLRAWIGAADSAGLQVAVHAIGERANGLLLDIYDSVAQAHGPRDRRFRVEHAQHLRRQDIGRIARLRRDRLDAALPRDRRWALGGKADRPRADQDTLCLPLLARRGSAPRLRLRLDRGADRSDPGHLCRGDPADAGWQESRAAGFRSRKISVRGGAPGLHGGRMPTGSLPSRQDGMVKPGPGLPWPTWCIAATRISTQVPSRRSRSNTAPGIVLTVGGGKVGVHKPKSGGQ